MNKIVFDDVTKKFNDKIVLKNTSFKIDDGVTLMISDNGTGKSTIIYIIMGNYNIDSGKVYVNGYNPVKKHKKAFNEISLMPEKTAYFGSSFVNEYIDFFSKLRNIDKYEIYDYLSYFGMDYIKHKNIRSLSMGETQLLYISCYLSGNFGLYIFDEPNSNIDQDKRKKFSGAVYKKYINYKSSFLITSHINDELTYHANNILTISKCKIGYYKENKNVTGYILKLDNIENPIDKLKNFDYFIINDSIIIKNSSINNIIKYIDENEIKSIIKIPESMVDYYESKK